MKMILTTYKSGAHPKAILSTWIVGPVSYDCRAAGHAPLARDGSQGWEVEQGD